MKRIYSLLLCIPLAVTVACAAKHSSSSSNGGSTGDTGTGDGTGDGTGTGTGDGTGTGTGTGGDGTATPDDLAKNPIEGIGAAAPILETGVYTDGPVWDKNLSVIFFAAPLGQPGLYRMRADGSTSKVRDGDRTAGTIPFGNTIAADGTLITVQMKSLVAGGEGDAGGAPSPIATGYPGEGGTAAFDTLNDAVAAKSGDIYMTDPGYFGTPIANRIFHVLPSGQVTVVEAFDDVPRPNGIALSPDQKYLYVGLTSGTAGSVPMVRKYIVNDDMTLGEWSKLIEFGAADEPDGIEVDQAGNLYVATKAGVNVYKSDGSSIGSIAVPEQPTGMAFGDADLKSLFITTQGAHIFLVKVNVPGIVQ